MVQISGSAPRVTNSPFTLSQSEVTLAVLTLNISRKLTIVTSNVYLQQIHATNVNVTYRVICFALYRWRAETPTIVNTYRGRFVAQRGESI